jgi:anti-sigma B factor antagonist
MHIQVEPRDNYAILHLRGEFDTFYVPAFQEEIESLTKAGVVHVVLNLRLVKFINSTALGALIKASKVLAANGGQLQISRPSRFCKDIIEKVGLDRVIPVHGSDESAAAAFGLEVPESQTEADFEVDTSSVIFSPIDLSRVEHFLSEEERGGGPVNPVHGHSFGGRWSGIARMSGLDEAGLSFTWSGGTSGLSPFEMGQLLAIGTQWKIKFRLPLLKKGYCEATATTTEVEERPDGVKVSFQFDEITEETRDAVKQYSADMAYLKDELRHTTDND